MSIHSFNLLLFLFHAKHIIEEGVTWIADQSGGLLQSSGTSFEQYQPDSPEGIATGEMVVYNKILYAAAGSVDPLWNPQGDSLGIYIFKEEGWTTINRKHYPQIDSLLDYISIAPDPADQTIWAGSFGGGLLHIKADRSFEIFKQNFLGPYHE